MTSSYWPSCDHPKGTFITPVFFFVSFFSLFCCTYNSIDLCCCKSLEIGFYWFHFSGELFFLTHFFSEQAPCQKKKKKKKHSLCWMFTDNWRKCFVFHSQQSNGSGCHWTNVHLPVRFIVRPVSKSPTPPVFFRLGTPHMIITTVCWLLTLTFVVDFFFDNLKTVLYWFNDAHFDWPSSSCCSSCKPFGCSCFTVCQCSFETAAISCVWVQVLVSLNHTVL